MQQTQDRGSIPGLGRSTGGGNGNPFKYSSLKNPMNRRARQAIVERVTELDMTELTYRDFFFDSRNRNMSWESLKIVCFQ